MLWVSGIDSVCSVSLASNLLRATRHKLVYKRHQEMYYIANRYIMCKVRIRTILGFSCATFGSQICAANPGSHGSYCANLARI